MNGIKWGRVDKPATPIKNAIIIASGPSVSDIDLELLQHLKKDPETYIIAVNGAGEHVPFADAWFTLDPWGLTTTQLPARFKGKMYAAVPDDYGTPNARAHAHRVTSNGNVTFLHRLVSHNYTTVSSDSAFKVGLSEDSSCINTGNSGYGALNLVYHLRPKNIFLLGIDGTFGYFYTKSTTNRPLTNLQTLFNSAVPQLKAAGINVFNVSPKSTINAYKKITPEEFYPMVIKHANV